MFFAKSKLQRVSYSLPILIIIGIWAFQAYCFHVGFMQQTILTSANMLFQVIPYHILLVLFMWSHLLAVVTDPGTIPSYFDYISEENKLSLPEDLLEKEAAVAKMSFCSKCQRYRPARTHHCSMCGRCVQRMDHHCPWVANCVGFRNHKYFLQCLFYCSIGSWISGLSCANLVLESKGDCEFVTFLGMGSALGIAVVIGGLGIFHLWLLMNNLTTIEMRTSSIFNVFDLGAEKNLKQIFGSSWLSYLLPIPYKPEGDGMRFPVFIRNETGEASYFEEHILV